LGVPAAALAQTAVRINAGGWSLAATDTDPGWIGDRYTRSDSALASTWKAIDVTGVARPAPLAVYRSSRYSTDAMGFGYTVGTLQPGQLYAVTLHFAESYFTAAGQRVFDVSLNGVPVLTGFDIFAAAGRADAAVTRTFFAVARDAGTIQVQFTPGPAGRASVNGIEVVPAPAARTVAVETWTQTSLASPQDLANAPTLLGGATIYSEADRFEGPANLAGNVVSRLIARFAAPVTGPYRFWVTADQKAMAWIAPDAPDFAGRPPICQVTTPPPPLPGQWDTYAEQASAPLILQAGRTYYLMAIQADGDGNGVNHLSVGWTLPDLTVERPIRGTWLVLTPPAIVSLSAARLEGGTGAQHVLSWSVSNATACSASTTPADLFWTGPRSEVGGSQVVAPAKTTTYRLTCTGVNGVASTAETTVTVGPPILPGVTRNPRAVQFVASADHDRRLPDGTPVVTGYRFEVYMAGATAPFHTIAIGKPTPGDGALVTYDFSSTIAAWPLPGGTYEARVAAVGPHGTGTSTPSNPFDVDRGTY
jgi:hypothetical protein